MYSSNSQAEILEEILLNGDFQREIQILFPFYCSSIHSIIMAELFYSPPWPALLGVLAIIQIRAEPILKSLSMSLLGENLEELTISNLLFVFLSY